MAGTPVRSYPGSSSAVEVMPVSVFNRGSSSIPEGSGAAKASGCPRKCHRDVGHRPGHSAWYCRAGGPGGHPTFPADPGHQHERPGQRRQRQHEPAPAVVLRPPARSCCQSEQNEGDDDSSLGHDQTLSPAQRERQGTYPGEYPPRIDRSGSGDTGRRTAGRRQAESVFPTSQVANP